MLKEFGFFPWHWRKANPILSHEHVTQGFCFRINQLATNGAAYAIFSMANRYNFISRYYAYCLDNFMGSDTIQGKFEDDLNEFLQLG